MGLSGSGMVGTVGTVGAVGIVAMSEDGYGEGQEASKATCSDRLGEDRPLQQNRGAEDKGWRKGE